MGKKNNVGRLTLLDIKTYYKVTVIKTKLGQNKTNSLVEHHSRVTQPDIKGHFIYDNGDTVV